jgi:hypothetical protein
MLTYIACYFIQAIIYFYISSKFFYVNSYDAEIHLLIQSTSTSKVPSKGGHRRWRREADPEPKGKKVWVPKKLYRPIHAPKKAYRSKKW